MVKLEDECEEKKIVVINSQLFVNKLPVLTTHYISY